MITTPTMLPEWAPVRAVLLAWPYVDSDWRASLKQVEACYFDMLAAITRYADAWVLLHPSLDESGFRDECRKRGTPQSRVRVLRLNYNDTWIRDYGPISLDSGYLTFRFNGWGGKYSAENDNAVAQQIPRLSVESVDLVCEGGALETNGQVLLLNADCIVDELRNPGFSREAMAQRLAEHLGIADVEWLENVTLTGDDTDGHIDTLARFADGRRIIYSGCNDRHPDADVLRRLHQQIQELTRRRGWEAMELPSPVVNSALDNRPLPATYANFLFVNDAVLAPIYGVAEDDRALIVLERAMPGKTIVPVRCEALLEQHGSLHCATMQVAALSNY